MGLCVDRGDNSTDQLRMTASPGTVLDIASQSDEYVQSLQPFWDDLTPLDLCYVSLHSYWLHQSNIPLRLLRLVRDRYGFQQYYYDDDLHGTWEFQRPNWLGISRPWSQGGPGLTRWYEAVPGTLG